MLEVLLTGKYNSNDVCLDAEWAGPSIVCCEGAVINAAAIVPQGSLTPTQLVVTGTCFGCASDLVTISINKMAGGGTLALIAPSTVAVDPTTGGFSGAFSLIATGVRCADQVVVSAACTSGLPCNIAPFRGPIDCPQCFRAEPSVVVAPCNQPDDPSTQVTITFRIALRKGDAQNFALDFGNGQTPFTFTIDNSTGDTDAVYAQTAPASTYNTGQQYTATLRIPALPECPPVTVTFRVDCTGCPQVIATVAVGNCITAGTGVNPNTVGTRPVKFTVDVPQSVPSTLVTTANFHYGGGTDRLTGRISSPSPLQSRTGPGQIEETAYLSAGTYTPAVTLTFIQGNQLFCLPEASIQFNNRPAGQPPAVDVLSCLVCPPNGVIVSKTQNPPAAPHWQLPSRRRLGSRPSGLSGSR